MFLPVSFVHRRDKAKHDFPSQGQTRKGKRNLSLAYHAHKNEILKKNCRFYLVTTPARPLPTFPHSIQARIYNALTSAQKDHSSRQLRTFLYNVPNSRLSKETCAIVPTHPRAYCTNFLYVVCCDFKKRTLTTFWYTYFPRATSNYQTLRRTQDCCMN